jgi:putative spermidine/putrescine transport system ATP-binding protein
MNITTIPTVATSQVQQGLGMSQSETRGEPEPRPVDLVHFDGVSKTYDGKTLVVDNLNLKVRKGEFLTLLGPSGSGKTTCLMMLAGFEAPSSGSILMDGRAINRMPPQKRNMGVVFQNYALFPHMTIFDNLAFPLAARKMDKREIEQRVVNAVSMVRLQGMERRKPEQLSGGQQQRVALARAMIFEPSLVLMDEPLGALDKNLRVEMQYEIKALHERLGITIVYVTHDQSEALTMSDRVAVFHHGRIQQICPPAELYNEPRNAFVARFIGENNRLTGVVREVHDETCSVLLPSGATVMATRVAKLQSGDETIVSIRPERVQVSQSEVSFDPKVEGEVRQVIFHGDHIRVRLCVEGDEEFVMKMSTKGAHVPQVGEKMVLTWGVDDGRALGMESAK